MSRNLRVNKNKSRVMKCTKRVGGRRINVAWNSELLEKVKCFKYLGSKTTLD